MLPELPKHDHAFQDLDGDRPDILVWRADAMRAYASLAVRDHRAEIERLQRLVYVPGLWRCPKCQFNLMRTELNVATGTARADDTPGEKCPNCQSPLWRVTERDAGNDLVARLEVSQQRVAALERQLKEATDSVTAKDAERYRWLRDWSNGRERKLAMMQAQTTIAFDSAIDKQIADGEAKTAERIARGEFA